MNKLDDWQRTCEDHEERFRAVREEMATLDDGLACAEERLAAKRAAKLEERAKEVEQGLPVITAQLGMLWNKVTGSGRPVPSEIQLTLTGTKMTTEEHVVTAETYLRYAEGHLQPSEEYLADAEVHLKLVKAHLAALDVVELDEASPLETATPPPPKPSGGETKVGRTRVAPVERERSPAIWPRAGPVQRGRRPAERAEGTPPLERGRSGRALSTNARIRRPTPWTSARSSRACRSPRGRRRSKNGIAANAASRIAETERRARGVTAGSGFGGITY
jgi:hypothetical protein